MSQETTIDPKEINLIFKTYYSTLCNSEFPDNDSPMLEFLRNLDVPMLNQDQRTALEPPIQLQEIEESIR